ncbi:hypothetical protein [Lacimicrobium alkaliphilum]|uniref:Uncharacterized protein n=1 Tax=Lacimicrobium alkaliphilum TaxID=1526571 RepID=A0ABQ1RQ97_9ALTE|nr:hypothetical protein [Lacimicrobium alkaliphilum]GGD74672.1 hypothetical protein GCM10011357_32140 [Lacimicrobium alkaliphilum]
MDIKQAIEQQNRAFVKRVNVRLGEPLPKSMLDKQLEQNDPFLVAQLVVKTQKKLNEGESVLHPKTKLTKFDRFILWIKGIRK